MYDVDSVIKTCHISFNGKSDLELSEALSSCHCSLDVRDFSPLSLSEFAQAAGVEALGKNSVCSYFFHLVTSAPMKTLFLQAIDYCTF